MASSDVESNTDDWQTTKETVRERSSFLFNSSLMSDIRFTVIDSCDNSKYLHVPVHKFVLAISSPVFYSMFYGQLHETNAEVELPDTESKNLLEFLRFVYSDDVNLTSSNVLGVMYLAKKYIVPPLLKKCACFLEEQINEENVFETLMEARKFDQHELEERCMNIVEISTEQCLRSESIATLDQQTMTQVLKRDTLNVNECSLFRAVKKWAEKECENRQLKLGGAYLREFIGDALNYIRFPTMPQDKFAQEVVPTGILTESEVIAIFLHFNSVTPEPYLRFSTTPRSSKDPERCCLYSDCPAPVKRCDLDNRVMTAEYTSITESLDFVTDKPVLFKGVRLFAREYENIHFNAELHLLNSEHKDLGNIKGTFCTQKGGLSNWIGFDVELFRPVHLRRRCHYSITVVITNAGRSNVAKSTTTPLECGRFSASSVLFNVVTKSRSNPILELLFYNIC